MIVCVCIFFCQSEGGIRDLVRSRGLGDVYKRQVKTNCGTTEMVRLPKVPLPNAKGTTPLLPVGMLNLSLIHI